jgi:hypothetical protein
MVNVSVAEPKSQTEHILAGTGHGTVFVALTGNTDPVGIGVTNPRNTARYAMAGNRTRR